MAASDTMPSPMPVGGDSIPPGRPMSMQQHLLDKGAQMMQSLEPVKKMKQHVCSFAIYNHDMTRQIKTHHYITRLNQDFLQCAVYDSNDSDAHLIGDELQIGAPALMMSPQAVPPGVVKPEMVKKRDEEYNISTEALRQSRVEIEEPQWKKVWMCT